MVTSVLFLSTVLTSGSQQTPVTVRNPPLQEDYSVPQQIEEILVTFPAKIVKQAESSEVFRAYQGQVTDTSQTAPLTTNVVSVVVTDLDEVNPRPSGDEICELHNRAVRTRANQAGQLFKSEKTTIDGRPMIVNIGSVIGLNGANKAINMNIASAAFSTATKAYEITWISLNGGEEFATAIRAVRSIKIAHTPEPISPKKLIGSQGEYTFLGNPNKFHLPSSVIALPDSKPTADQSAHYIGQLSGSDWFATAEIAVMKNPVTDASPANLLSILGYEGWAPLNPEFTLVGGIHRCLSLPISAERHARIDIAINGDKISAIIVSGPKDSALPTPEVIRLIP